MQNLIRMGLIGVLTLCSFIPKTHAFEDAIIAVVNDELITLKDLRDYIQSTYVSLVAEGMPDAQLKKVMGDLEVNGINKLIEDKLILSKANEIGIIVRDKLVDERVEKIKKKYASEQAFMDSLIQNGATLTDLRNKILNQLKIQFVIEHEIKSKIYVNPQEVTEFYENNMSDFQRPDRVDLDSIYIASNGNMKQARARSEEAAKLLAEGKDFKEVSAKYSDAPSIGIVERGQTLPTIEKTIFNLAEGEVSEAVEIEGAGIYIFKLIRRTPARNASLEEVKNSISQRLEQKKFKEAILRWLKKLKEDAYIEIKE